MSENGNGNGQRFITKDFKFASERRTVDIDCRPDMDCVIRLRAVGYGDSRKMADADTMTTLSMMIVDETGERLFTTEEDVKNLSEMPVNLVTRLVQAAAALNGISKEAMEEAKKNYLASQIAVSASV